MFFIATARYVTAHLFIVTVSYVSWRKFSRQYMLCIVTVLFVTVHVLLRQYMLCIVTVIFVTVHVFIATVYVVYCDSPFCDSTCFYCDSTCCVLWQSFFVTVRVFTATVHVVYCDVTCCDLWQSFRDSTCFYCDNICNVLWQPFFVTVHVLLRQYMFWFVTDFFVTVRVFTATVHVVYCDVTCCAL